MGKSPYIPPPIPPKLEGLYVPDFVRSLGEANRALARLGELPSLLPNLDLLAAPLLRKEAILSSKIEGTQTTLGDLYKYEAKIDDHNVNRGQAKEVENYVKAMHRGMDDLSTLSLSLRTIRNMHGVLLQGVRNEQGVPGEFRNFQNYIAPRGTPIEEASYVPPAPQHVLELMSQMEVYLNKNDVVEDPIIQCGLLHYQFEAIHPFGDGNGRIGRLLVPLFFFERGIIGYPLVYISEFCERHDGDYRLLLRNVSEKQEWKPWLRFFVEAVKTQSGAIHKRGRKIIDLYREYHEQATKLSHSSNAVALVDHLFKSPYTAAPVVAKRLRITQATAMRLLESFLKADILTSRQGRVVRPKYSRPVRLFVLQKLIDILNS